MYIRTVWYWIKIEFLCICKKIVNLRIVDFIFEIVLFFENRCVKKLFLLVKRPRNFETFTIIIGTLYV